MTAEQSARSAAVQVAQHSATRLRIGVEMSFLPVEAFVSLQEALMDARFSNATFILELLRADKTPGELKVKREAREASDNVADSMLAVFSSIEEGATKQEIVQALEREEVSRGLTFEYCLINMGTIFNPARSDQAWRKGDVPALDSGGSSAGYIGDLTRMAVLGESDAELVDLLAEVEYIQQAARRTVGSGAKGGDIYIEPNALVSRLKHKSTLEFVAPEWVSSVTKRLG
jgi:Xaa-Pro aminopeptidase